MSVQDLWQGQYQVLSIIFLNELTEVKCKYVHTNK